MMAPLRLACSSAAINRSNPSTGDMGHFQPNIDRACGVRQAADRDVIDSSGRNAVHIFQSDPAARFEFDAVSSQRDGLRYLSGRRVVEQNYVYSVEVDVRTNLFQVIGLPFDADVLTCRAETGHSAGKTGESFE